MNIWHICCLGGYQCSGMTQVIPHHANTQAKYAEVIIINLAEYKPTTDDCVVVYNKTDFDNIGFKGICEANGKPDIIVIHGIYLPEMWKVWKKVIYRKIPYVIVPHGSLTYKTQSRHRIKKFLGNIYIVNKIVKHATLLQFLSKGEERTSATMGNGNVFVNPNGIYCYENIKLKEKNQTSIKLVYIGRYDLYHKGLGLLIDACEKNKDYLREHNISIEMYGDTKAQDYNEIEKRVKKFRVDDIMHLHGPVFDEEKKEKYMSGTYFLLSSKSEGFPMGFLEACACGLPVLVTEQTNTGDDVREFKNGCVVYATVEDIGQLFYFAVENMNRYLEMSANSLACARKYEWSSISKRAVEKYEERIGFVEKK